MEENFQNFSFAVAGVSIRYGVVYAKLFVELFLRQSRDWNALGTTNMLSVEGVCNHKHQ